MLDICIIPQHDKKINKDIIIIFSFILLFILLGFYNYIDERHRNLKLSRIKRLFFVAFEFPNIRQIGVAYVFGGERSVLTTIW